MKIHLYDLETLNDHSNRITCAKPWSLLPWNVRLIFLLTREISTGKLHHFRLSCTTAEQPSKSQDPIVKSSPGDNGAVNENVAVPFFRVKLYGIICIQSHPILCDTINTRLFAPFVFMLMANKAESGRKPLMFTSKFLFIWLRRSTNGACNC